MTNRKNQNLFNNYKKENNQFAHFLNTLNLTIRSIDSPDITERSQKAPDYMINNEILIEVKQLYDGASVKRSAQWGIVTNKLQKLLSESFLKNKLKGLFSVETPSVYKLNGDKNYRQVTADIIESIKVGKKNITSCGISLKIEKVNDKYNEVYLSSFSEGNINPPGTIFQNIAPMLRTANTQLGYNSQKNDVKRKILLIVNKYTFADRVSEVIEGLSYCYEDLLSYENIDEIWFQQEVKDGIFSHTRIYDHNFLLEFDKSTIDPASKINQEMYQLWYWALDKKDDKKLQLWDALKKFVEKHQPAEIFNDPFKRQEMTRLGLWLLKQGKEQETVWLINRFINDPDPIEPPEDYRNDLTFDYHSKIKSGEELIFITSVMGHLAWTVLELARKSSKEQPNNLIEAYKFVNRVLTERKNFYTIQQWLIPLAEISNRRMLLLDKSPDLYKSFKELLIGKRGNRSTSLVGTYGKYKALAKHLTHSFSYFKDLTTEEVNFVLNNLKSAEDDYAALLIYFAIYRPNHYKKDDLMGKKFGKIEPEILVYNGEHSQKLLKELITENKRDYQMQTIAWNFWKIVKDDPDQFQFLKSWINLLFELKTNFSVYPYLEFILEDNIKSNPQECTEWLIKLFNSAKEYLKDHDQKEFTANHVMQLEKTLDWIEENRPTEFEEIKEKLKELKHIIFFHKKRGADE